MELDRSVIADLLERMPELGPYAAPACRRIRGRTPGFESLCRIVVEQAVSQASADAIWRRLQAQILPFEAGRLFDEDSGELRRLGLSKGKAACLHGLAGAVLDGRLDLDALERAPDEEVRRVLSAHRGIGRWTADIYLLLTLGRPDVWPAHDLALQEGLRIVRGLDARPTAREADAFGQRLRPHRSTGAVLLWEGYLAKRTDARAARKRSRKTSV